jgi:predicted NBD/HSP70 family sugar kinase
MTESLTPVPPVARRLNLAAALNALWSTDEMTARDLMDATGLTRATVHAVCNDLIERGWIRELEPRHADSRRPAGRPSRVFELNREGGYILGLDVGEAHLGVIVADLGGEPRFNRRFDLTRARTRTQRRAHLVRSIDEALRVAGVSRRQLIVAAVGLAAPVSRDGSVVGYADDDRNPYWRRFRLDRETLAQALEGTNLLVDNDANLAVLGERWRGVARGVDDLVVLLASERLGAGMMESGRVLRGHYGGAGEMYWLDLVDGIEGAFGFAYLARTWAREALADGRESTLLEHADGSADSITAEMVFEAAAGGDPIATEVIERLARPVAQIICMMSIMLNPRLVVIDGAIAGSAGVLLPRVDRELARIAHDPPRVMCSTLGDTVVSIGAVRLALDHVQANVLDISPSGMSDRMLRQA